MDKILKILMADDDTDEKFFMATAIKEAQLPHFIEFVSDGQELINNLTTRVTTKTELPDFILLDLNMPVKDGQTALKEIKSNPHLKHIATFIFSTAVYDEKRVTDLIKDGAEKYITKPNFSEQVTFIKNLCNEMAVKRQQSR